MIKFEHTVFALPFGLAGMLMAARGLPHVRVIFWIVAASVFARTAAMSFNRWADACYDERNPRTRNRAIPAGQVSLRFALVFAVVNAVLFVFSAAMLNSLTLALSPLALLILFGYSYTKRFTVLSHFVLGLALALAPVGAWIAVRAELSSVPVMMGCAIILWTAGFDIIYACQDYDIDRSERLFSIPVRVGIAQALNVSGLLHVLCIIMLVAAGVVYGSGAWYYAGCGATAILLVAEHAVVNPRDLSRIHVAFFTINSWVGVTMLLFIAMDTCL